MWKRLVAVQFFCSTVGIGLNIYKGFSTIEMFERVPRNQSCMHISSNIVTSNFAACSRMDLISLVMADNYWKDCLDTGYSKTLSQFWLWHLEHNQWWRVAAVKVKILLQWGTDE